MLWATESSSFSAGDRRKLRKLLNRKVDAGGHQTLDSRKLSMETVRPVACVMVQVKVLLSFPDTRTVKQKWGFQPSVPCLSSYAAVKMCINEVITSTRKHLFITRHFALRTDNPVTTTNIEARNSGKNKSPISISLQLNYLIQVEEYLTMYA